jgi:uncharacterized protein
MSFSLMTHRLMTHRLMTHPIIAAVMGGITGTAFWTYTSAIEPNWMSITRHRIALRHLPPAFEGYRVLHFSDLHYDTTPNAAGLLRRVATIAEQEQVDLIAFTGDLVSHQYAPVQADLIQGLGRIQAPDGVLAVIGNHDYWVDPVESRRVMAAGGMVVLENAVQTIQRGDQCLYIAGLDNAYFQVEDVSAVVAQLPPNAASLLLVHEPDFAVEVAHLGRFGLQLSGHSHGGQVRLPGVGAILLPSMGRRYPMGLYRIDQQWLYTSRGIGTIQPSVRLFCRPEVTIFTLVCA